MAVIGSFPHVGAQLAFTPRFESAMAYIKKCFMTGSVEYERIKGMQPGDNARHELGDGVFTLEQCYVSREDEEVQWESHKAHVDVQVIFSGQEMMELTDRALLEVDEDLTPEKDVVFYRPYQDCSRLKASPGFIAVFFPEDAHRPSLRAGDASVVQKMVVKVPVED